MASVNLDLARSIYAEWERGDFSRSDWADPDIEFVFADGPAPVRGRAPAELSIAWRNVLSAWGDYRAAAEGYRELDSGDILGLTIFSAPRRAGDTDPTQVLARGASVMRIQEGRVTKLVLFFDRDHAFADLGLAREGSAAS
jgi:ketosteroid isomerase-like protein